MSLFVDIFMGSAKLYIPTPPSKGVSDLKACLDYCEDPARRCENLIYFFPAQTEPFC